jgi:hypothetical protein
MLDAMQSRQIVAVGFWIGFALSLALSLILISAFGAFGLQAGPLWIRLVAVFLIVMSFAAIVARRIMGPTASFDLMTGLAMLIVVFGYAATTLAMNR